MRDYHKLWLFVAYLPILSELGWPLSARGGGSRGGFSTEIQPIQRYMAENTTGAAYGGHDYDFIDKVADRLNCQICTKVLCEPHLAVCCGQHFCESCLNKWFARQRGKQSCPHCRAEGDAFHHVINKGLRSEVNQLKIRCCHHGDGCQWTGELGALKTHLESESGCGFVTVECPNKCVHIFGDYTYTMLRKDIKKHLAQDCYLRPYMCEFCGVKDTYEEITGVRNTIQLSLRASNVYSGHQATCPETPLTCPNKCGSVSVKRKDMESHRSKCPKELVECPFAEAGCEVVIRRCQLQDHMTYSQQKHLLMLMMDNQMTKKALKESRDKLTEAMAKLGETESSLLNTQAKLIGAEDKLSEAVERLCLLEDHIASASKLQKEGDSVEVAMPKFSEYRRSGKVWHSPPFYYREGYKMCLAVYANGVGGGAGTHVSLSLLLLKGKYDNQLKWPMKFCKGGHSLWKYFIGRNNFLVCSENHRVVNEQKVIRQADYFCRLDSDALHLVNDSLTLAIKFGDECHLKVYIV